MTDTQQFVFEYSSLQAVHVGQKLTVDLPRQISQAGLQRVLLVSNRSLAAASGDFAELRECLGTRCAGLFSAIRSHTPREDVLALLAQARAVNADLLLAIGGGSVIDACKAVQLAIDVDVQSEQQLLAYAQRSDGERGERAGQEKYWAEQSRIRQWAVPSTLSGAEFSNNAGVLDTQRAAKEGYRAPRLCPQRIFYDPALSLHTPEWLWLSTAIRSLDHAIEGYCSPKAHHFLQGHFLHAMRLLATSLPAVKADNSDLQNRSLNQQAVWLACCGLGTVPHGASHGIGYILGSLCAVPHGHTSCVMLPAVLAWNAQQQPEQHAAIAAALGRPGEAAATVVRELIAGLGLPVTLAGVGVDESQWPEIADRAARHPVVRNNPREITTPAQVLEILQLASG